MGEVWVLFIVRENNILNFYKGICMGNRFFDVVMKMSFKWYIVRLKKCYEKIVI